MHCNDLHFLTSMGCYDGFDCYLYCYCCYSDVSQVICNDYFFSLRDWMMSVVMHFVLLSHESR